MDTSFIEKPALKQEPNLKDYEAAKKSFSYDEIKKELEYYEDGKQNIAHTVIDRYKDSEKLALIWEGDDSSKNYTFKDIYKETNKFANVLTNLGVKKGDRVFLFLPRIPELYISFLGTIKTGAICGTLFSAFGPSAIKDRVGDAEAMVVVTTKELRPRLDKVLPEMPSVKHVIESDGNYAELMKEASDVFETVHMEEDDPETLRDIQAEFYGIKNIIYGP